MLVLDVAKRFAQVNVFGLNPNLIKIGIWSNFLDGNKLVSSLVEGLIVLLSPSVKVYAECLITFAYLRKFMNLTALTAHLIKIYSLVVLKVKIAVAWPNDK
jgi:hypothetical protein